VVVAFRLRGGGQRSVLQEPEADPLPELDVGAPPERDGGVPEGAFEFEPFPMSGQFLVEVELDPEPEPEPELELELELELDDGVVGEEWDVEEFDVELVPVLPERPVVVDVVAALATSAPPAMRPDVNAPVASTVRRRICMGVPFLS
jgi:hypothetical protein